MTGALLVLLYGFFMGLRRGSSSCLALCMPAIVPALIEDGGTWKKGVKIALWFNIPRIALLTVLGIAIGAGGFIIGNRVGTETGSGLWAAGYAIIGAMMFVYGLYVFSSADERLGALESGEQAETCRPKHPLVSRIRMAAPRGRLGLLLWGGMVSLACIGETVLSLEAIFVGVSGIGLGSAFEGAIFGGLAFFLFALGASVPSMVFAGLGSGLASREKRQRRLLQAERISGVLMVIFGAIFISTLFL